MKNVRLLALLGFTLIALSSSAFSFSAVASADASGWQVIGRSVPTNLPPGGAGLIYLYVYNIGAVNATAGATLDAELPEGITATSFSAENEEVVCTGTGSSSVTCGLPAVEAGRIEIITVHVAIGSKVPTGKTSSEVTVSGGGALESTRVPVPLTVSSSDAGAGFANMAAWASNPDGTIDTQAGSHPYDFIVAFALNNIVEGVFFGNPGEHPAGGQARTINVNLPPGMVGNPQAIPQCPRYLLDTGYSGSCPFDTLIGEDQSTISGVNLVGTAPVFNMVPPPGVAAEFAFIQGGIVVLINSGVRTGGDNGITAHTRDLPERKITFNTTKIWGVPADERHNRERCLALTEYGGASCPAGVAPEPLLSLGTSCGAPPEYSIEELGTWQDEKIVPALGRYVTTSNEGAPVGWSGCERLQPFKPLISISPDTTYADTPAGLSVDVKMPLGLNREGLETSNLKDTTVVLPEGVAINPGQATGLQACRSEEEAMGSEPDGEVKEGPVSCPSASKVGTDEISSPLLRDKLKGDVYILGSNPPNLQLLVAASGDGVNLKLVGDIHLDESTGRLTTTFENTPDIPFSDFKLSFSGGAQAALATPTKCGTYESMVDFSPWSTPFVEGLHDASLFQIAAGTNGSPCAAPMPFAPSMTAGSTTDQAGGYTSFTMLLTRGDGQQRIRTLSFKTPEGLLGMISKVPLCEEPQAADGTCSSASQIGHTVVGAGPGPYPFYIPQAGASPAPIYLTGPYKGAPFGLSIVVPLMAGPFNLGTEVIRGRIEVDSRTSQITVATEPLPVTVKGIPDDLRSIDAVIDRPEFMFNPTDCSPMSFTGSATSVEGATAALSSHFQMGSCQALKFQPNFTVSTSGKTSRADGASLTAKIVYPVGNLGFNQASSQSNIQSVKVDLPKQLPSRLTTLQKACPAARFAANPASCPVNSVVGHVKAITPVLPVPLEGPAYFVSHAGEEFPNLILVLQGDNVTVDLVGDTFINSKTDVTSSTFQQIPDVPIQSFELNLPQGKYSALAANTNLCKVKGGLKMPTAFVVQNAAEIHETTPLTVTNCTKATKHKAKPKAKNTQTTRRGKAGKRRVGRK